MKLTPIYTEKSTKEAKAGKYSFWVSGGTKTQIKAAVNETFGVHVTKISTINYKAVSTKTLYGKVKNEKFAKKAVVQLKKGERLNLFEQEKEKKKGKKK